MKTLSIHAPWAWAIVHGHKKVENRTWATSHRGRLAIHASRSRDSDAIASAILGSLGIELPSADALPRQCIVGEVQLVDCLQLDRVFDMDLGPLADGPVVWILERAIVYAQPIPIAGKQGIWEFVGGHGGAVSP